MAFDCHEGRPLVSLPALGAPLDIREEEGDGAAWELGHDPAPDVRLDMFHADCRTADG